MHRRTRRQRHHQRQPLHSLEAHSCQSRQSTGRQERRPVVKSRTDGWQGSFGRATGVHLAALCSVYPSITRRCEGGAMVRISHSHRPTWQRAMERATSASNTWPGQVALLPFPLVIGFGLGESPTPGTRRSICSCLPRRRVHPLDRSAPPSCPHLETQCCQRVQASQWASDAPRSSRRMPAKL
jgi:hypothetical protein